MQLEMKGWDINTYIATFDWLVARAGWSTSDKGVMENFRNGLAWWLALNIMHKYENIPATLDEWKTATKKEILQRAQIKAEIVRLKLAFCTTCAIRVLVLAQGPSFLRLRRA